MFGSIVKSLRRAVPINNLGLGRYGSRVWENMDLLMRRAHLTEAEIEALKDRLAHATYVETSRGDLSVLNGLSLGASAEQCGLLRMDPFEAALHLMKARLDALKYGIHIDRANCKEARGKSVFTATEIEAWEAEIARDEAEFGLLHRAYCATRNGLPVSPLEDLSLHDEAEIAYRTEFRNAMTRGADREEASRLAHKAAWRVEEAPFDE